ncbi:peptide chain release factor N(5)-glutamine methyltransferase [Parenemella sanctibonifatiensis]|uniref:Release factor glutamine methyltransferase n=1 Tax=Parenemella sanctibonifatiensis TaxID=2016505 RepID=A0A255EHE0_9ACTN|nr:peptide chain release factor N(5)-glutamine methyltransferase [Parenemella sanctibonifatiensis]OYN90946.1 protein-(glutamine-N5) methyltransferase, release factor-specific [Parenemella sanctibonifatiensis]
MTTIDAALAAGASRLTDAASPEADARLLLSHAWQLPLGRLGVEQALGTELPDEIAKAYADLLDRRAAGLPVQRIIGATDFCGVSLEVGPDVFVPRPETESLVAWGVQQLSGLRAPVVVDLCTGSGAIAAAVAHLVPDARVYATELSPQAHDLARRNLSERVELELADLRDAWPSLDGHVDLVLCNPPYIPLTAWEGVPAEVRDHDPELALFSGDDGLEAMRALAPVAARLLKPGGWLGAEHAEVQHESAPAIFVASEAFDRVQDRFDLTGRPRFVTARRRRASS